MTEDRTRALLELLYRVSREVATALDLRTVLQRVLFAALENVGGERGSIVVLDDAGKTLDATIVYGTQVHDHTTHQLQDMIERGLAGWVVQNRKPALVPDTSKDIRWLPRTGDLERKTGSKSALCVPLLARERLIGVLTLVHSIPNAFGEEHMELMQAIAGQAGIAVLNARMYTESQRQTMVMSALAESAATINSTLRLDEVLSRILNQTIQALQVETVALALKDPGSRGELVFRAATGQNAGYVRDKRIHEDKGLAGIVMRTGRGIIVPDVNAESLFTSADAIGGIETRAVALAPIQSKDSPIGVLEAINPTSGAFDPDAMLVLTGLGGLAGTAIQNAQLFERLEATNRRYRELFDESTDPIFLTDWNGQILEVNRMAGEILGYASKKLETLNIDQVHEINQEKTGPDFENLRSTQTCSYESALHPSDGHTVHVQVNVRAVEFEDSEMIQWTMHDISERKLLDDLRNDLTSMVYHDLRSPLANIISSLDILGGIVEKDETVASILNIATNSTTRIERLINSLLDINRLEAGQQIVSQKAVNIGELIHKTVQELKPATISRKQTLATDITNDLPLVWVDEDMIRRVLINLVENATKFAPMQGNIQIGTSTENNWVRITVHDDGPGIPANEREQIFEKFTRLKESKKTRGLGIGLAFCRLAVTGHGGTIGIDNETQNGTKFYFTLPTATSEQLASTEESQN
jgi:PAS domain S-box-containing protein